MFNGRRQPSNDGTSRMTRECQVRFCERLGVKFPGPTRQIRRFRSHARNPTHVGCEEQSGNRRRVAKATRMPSRPGEFHPEPLTDPDLNLSIHPARAID